MAPNRLDRSARDRSRINMGEESEAEYWAKTLGVSKARLVEVVNQVGDSLDAVRRELRSATQREV